MLNQHRLFRAFAIRWTRQFRFLNAHDDISFEQETIAGMGLGDISYSAVVSLKSIDSWISTINGNMAGSGRVGFRASRIKFGGGATSVDRNAVGNRLGIAYGEQTMFVQETNLDFSQGSVVASTEPTHFALQQNGGTASVPFFKLNTLANGTGTSYYTRDGEFHFDTNGLLVDSNGLFVMSEDGDAIGTDVANDITNGVINLNRFTITTTATPQLSLKMSRFGSTIFETTGIGTLTDITTVTATGDVGTTARVIPQSLESSNASLSSSVPELALAQKLYAAISKVIQVAQSNVDVALGLIR